MENSLQNKILDKPPKKWSYGKYLRSLKGLRKQDSSNLPLTSIDDKLSYLSYYQSQGLSINKVTFGRFLLKNGLPYEGLIATEPLSPYETVIKIPRNLTMNTRFAYLTEIRDILIENPDKFWLEYEIDEDSILILYMMYEMQKGAASKFNLLINNLPKDQDVMAFWPKEELDRFEDPKLINDCMKLLENMKKQYEILKDLVMKYPKIIDPKIFTYENYCWLACILMNRSFGNTTFGYVTMIPVAELFNHDCVDTTFKKDDKTQIDKNIDKINEDNYTTSEGTVDEEDSDCEDDFYKIEANITISSSFLMEKDIEQKEIIKEWLVENFEYTDLFALIFGYKVLACLAIESDPVRISEIFQECIIYRKELEIFYKEFLKYHGYDNYDSYLESLRPDTWDESYKKLPVDLFTKNFEEETYENIEFKTGKNEIYEKNSQVYYCYGRKSNRKLAYYYGMCIEHNKYEKKFVKIDYRDYIEINENFNYMIKGRKINKYKRFKLKYTRFNEELLAFFKLIFFDFKKNKTFSIFSPKDLELELKAVDASLEVIDKELKDDDCLKEDEKVLFDKNTNYHLYFAAIYRLEKQRVLIANRKLFVVYKEILNRIKKGDSLKESVRRIEELENEEEFQRNRYVLFDYLKKMAF